MKFTERNSQMKQIVLIGFMGAGKTTVGKELAKKLQLPLIDTDSLIEERLDKSIPEIFEQYGEEYFREMEAQVLESLKNVPGIIATGGGIVLKESTRRQLIKFNTVVYLTVDFDNLVNRIKKDEENQRPLFLNHSEQEFFEIYQSRIPLYESVATTVIENTAKKVASLADEIIKKVGV